MDSSLEAAWILEDDVLPSVTAIEGLPRAMELISSDDWSILYVVKRSRSYEFARMCCDTFRSFYC